MKQTILENERKEKIRRINKSLTNETNLKDRFGYNLKYPSAYKTVKDTKILYGSKRQFKKDILILFHIIYLKTHWKEIYQIRFLIFEIL